jgi:glycerophosphoryl diester phosphodiesterase
LEIGVNAIELDVRRTKDNQLVVIHDADVKRTTNGKELASELTLDEIKEFSTAKGEKMPALKEALNFLDSKVKILIELKEEGVEDQVLAVIREKGLQKGIIIVSFLENVLRKVKESEREV